MSGIIGVSGTRSGVIGEISISAEAFTSHTPVATGFASYDWQRAFYKRVGKMVYYFFDIKGTSNAATLYITNLPYKIKNTTNYAPGWTGSYLQDNGSPVGGGTFYGGANSFNLYCQLNSDWIWTGSGSKRAMGAGWYEAESI